MNPLFDAVIEATEEAILNAILASPTMTARGRTAHALPHDLLLAALEKYGRARRPTIAREHPARVVDQQPAQVGVVEARGLQPVGERGDDVGVARPAQGRVVGAQADVLAEQHLVEVAGVGEAAEPVEPLAGVVLVHALHGVELHPGATLGEGQVVVVVGNHVAVADDDTTGVDALLDEQVELGGADRPAGGVGGDGQTGTPVGAGSGPERPLLDAVMNRSQPISPMIPARTPSTPSSMSRTIRSATASVESSSSSGGK